MSRTKTWYGWLADLLPRFGFDTRHARITIDRCNLDEPTRVAILEYLDAADRAAEALRLTREKPA